MRKKRYTEYKDRKGQKIKTLKHTSSKCVYCYVPKYSDIYGLIDCGIILKFMCSPCGRVHYLQAIEVNGILVDRQEQKNKYNQLITKVECERANKGIKTELETIYRRKYTMTDDGKMMRVKYNNRRRSMLEDTGDYTTDEWKRVLDLFNNSCAYCGSQWDHVDHIIPLSDFGTNAIGNVIPACFSCNNSKSSNSVVKWYKNQKFFDVDKYIRILEYMIIE